LEILSLKTHSTTKNTEITKIFASYRPLDDIPANPYSCDCIMLRDYQLDESYFINSPLMFFAVFVFFVV